MEKRSTRMVHRTGKGRTQPGIGASGQFSRTHRKMLWGGSLLGALRGDRKFKNLGLGELRTNSDSQNDETPRREICIRFHGFEKENEDIVVWGDGCAKEELRCPVAQISTSKPIFALSALQFNNPFILSNSLLLQSRSK